MDKTFVGVGCSDYKLAANHLAGPKRDVARMLRLTTVDHGFSKAKTLVSGEATRAAILEALTRACATLRDRDQLVVLLSGHGYRVVRRVNGQRVALQCFAPWETDFEDPAFQHLYTADIKAALTPKGSANAQVIVFFDSCFSGNAMRAFQVSGAAVLRADVESGPPVRAKGILGPHWDVEGHRDVVPHTLEKVLAGDPRIICQAACLDTETAADTEDEDGDPGGAFTFSVLAAHATPANNSWRGLHDDGLAWLRAKGYTQTPVLTGPQAQFSDPSFTLKGSKALPDLPPPDPSEVAPVTPYPGDVPPAPTVEPAHVDNAPEGGGLNDGALEPHDKPPLDPVP